MISFRSFALRRGSRLLLSEVNLTLHAGWRLGVVGRNGCGKSSLFAALKGELEADAGELEIPARLRIASVAQETPSVPDSALDFVLAGDAEVAAALQTEQAALVAEDYEAVAQAHQRLEEIGGYDARARAGRLLHGLGFAPDTHEQAVSSFSGGWRVRLNLARALMMPSDLLLLDEPTNHLDLDAVLWLEQWLLKYPGTLLLISHDREFLDGISDHILHLEEGTARLYTGDYTGFERQRAEQLRQQQAGFEKEQAERAHLEAFINRFRAKASKARQAQSRVKRLEKLKGTEAVRAQRPIRIHFDPPEKLPTSLIQLRHADCGYGAGSRESGVENRETEEQWAVHGPMSHSPRPIPNHVVLHNVGFTLEAGDRIGLLGPNGAGKSTLVKSLLGQLPLLAGERVAHPDLCVGYFAQHTVEALQAGTSPMQHLQVQAPEASQQALRDYLGRWQFAGERAFESVDGFSGGERARLALALLAWHRPNVLLLDEPTNHLDLDMREALAEALADFPGAIVLVSHDRHLVGLVCDSFRRAADGRVEAFEGDLDDYAVWLRGRNAGNKTDAGETQAEVKRKAKLQARPKIDPAVGRRLKRIEKRLEEIQVERERVEQALADPDLYERAGAERVTELGIRQAELAREQERLEEEWLELA